VAQRLSVGMLAAVLISSTAVAGGTDVARRIEHIQHDLLPPVLIAGETAHTTELAVRMQDLHVPGVGIAVIHEGRLEWARGFGVSDVTGVAFPKLMHDLVLSPYAMKSSTYEQPLPAGLLARAAVPYRDDGSPGVAALFDCDNGLPREADAAAEVLLRHFPVMEAQSADVVTNPRLLSGLAHRPNR
jgi:CubicO group peptidase (beta-lactamase class C family)